MVTESYLASLSVTNTVDCKLVTKCRHELTSRHETHLVTSYEFLVLAYVLNYKSDLHLRILTLERIGM